MTKRKNPFNRVRLVYRRSKPLTKLVVAVAIVLSMAALITLRLAQDRIEAQTNDMLAEAARLEQENQELQDKIDTMDTVEGVVDIAQEELGLVEPDTIIIKPE